MLRKSAKLKDKTGVKCVQCSACFKRLCALLGNWQRCEYVTYDVMSYRGLLFVVTTLSKRARHFAPQQLQMLGSRKRTNKSSEIYFVLNWFEFDGASEARQHILSTCLDFHLANMGVLQVNSSQRHDFIKHQSIQFHLIKWTDADSR